MNKINQTKKGRSHTLLLWSRKSGTKYLTRSHHAESGYLWEYIFYKISVDPIAPNIRAGSLYGEGKANPKRVEPYMASMVSKTWHQNTVKWTKLRYFRDNCLHTWPSNNILRVQRRRSQNSPGYLLFTNLKVRKNKTMKISRSPRIAWSKCYTSSYPEWLPQFISINSHW